MRVRLLWRRQGRLLRRRHRRESSKITRIRSRKAQGGCRLTKRRRREYRWSAGLRLFSVGLDRTFGRQSSPRHRRCRGVRGIWGSARGGMWNRCLLSLLRSAALLQVVELVREEAQSGLECGLIRVFLLPMRRTKNETKQICETLARMSAHVPEILTP